MTRSDSFHPDVPAASDVPAPEGHDSLVPDRSSRLAQWGRSSRRVVLGSSTQSAVARGAVLSVLVGGLSTWAVYDRTVTVEVDGTAEQVRIFGTEVSDVLAAAGVEPGERDRVSPAVGESIGDGETVTVEYARPLSVSVDGVDTTYWTHERTVDAAIAAIGLRLDGAELSTSRSAGIGRGGLEMDVITRKDAVLVLAGAPQPLATTALTVADLLADNGVAVDDDDRVNPAPATVVTAGLTVTVNKVEVAQVVDSIPIPMPTRTVDSAEIYVGETDVVERGSDGVEQVTYDVTIVDGVEEARVEVLRAVATPPVERVVAKGTRARPARSAPVAAAPPAGEAADPGSAPAPAPVSSDADGLNWAALAACESGGNPSIVSSNGLYHGLYQFDAGTWRSMGGTGVASSAPASEQTARAKALYARRGASPWPSCGRKLFS